MIHEYAGLIRDVILNPDDDVPRLVIADWLEDNDDPERAAFIRLQCALAREEPGYCLDTSASWKIHDDSVNPKIRDAVDALRNVLLRFPIGNLLATGCVWRRGFVEEVTATPTVFCPHAETLFCEHPVRLVRLKGTHWQVDTAGTRWRVSIWTLGQHGDRLWRTFINNEKYDDLAWVEFDSESALLDRVNEACLTYGRRLRDEAWAREDQECLRSST